MVDASVGPVGGAADRDHHRRHSPAVVASADELAERLLGEGGVLRRVDLQGDVIGVDLGVAGRELLEQLVPLLGIELPADDGQGVEALAVAIGGTTDRPGGGTYHITWSLGPGRKAQESNHVLAAGGWTPFDLPMPVKLIPSCWPRKA